MGDADCDGTLTYADSNPFVLLLAGTYDERYPGCDGQRACDVDGTGALNCAGIRPFVAALTQ